jgi:hypothetical protein
MREKFHVNGLLKKGWIPILLPALILCAGTVLSPSVTRAGSVSPNGFDFDDAGITIHPDNWRYLYYKDETLCLTTSGSICNNLPLHFGDLDPSTIDCSLDEMRQYSVNHLLIVMEMRQGMPDSPVSEPLDFDADIVWNEDFFEGLRVLVAYACEFDIIVDLVFTTECLLESSKGRWEENIWNQENGGPVPSPGSNFFELEQPRGMRSSWNWKMWNTYYQRLYFEKILSTISGYPNVICNPCWEIDDMGFAGYNWFVTVSGWIHEIENYPHLIALTPCQPSEFCELACVDCFLIQNRGYGEEYLAYRKPVINAGPSAKSQHDEPTFMFQCATLGIHPATNLLSRCPEMSDGYYYSLRLQTFFDFIDIWHDEPGNEITPVNLPSFDDPCLGDFPFLEWSRDNGFENDGVNPDEGIFATRFDFETVYSHPRGKAPLYAEIWIDLDGDQFFDHDEIFSMKQRDGNFVTGATFVFRKSALSRVGEILYRFNFVDDEWGPAFGIPTDVHSFHIVEGRMEETSTRWDY